MLLLWYIFFFSHLFFFFSDSFLPLFFSFFLIVANKQLYFAWKDIFTHYVVVRYIIYWLTFKMKIHKDDFLNIINNSCKNYQVQKCNPILSHPESMIIKNTHMHKTNRSKNLWCNITLLKSCLIVTITITIAPTIQEKW